MMHSIARFANLEVLLCALLIYIAEAYLLFTIELQSGFYCLCAYVPMLVGSLITTTYAVRTAAAREVAGEKEL